MDGVENSTPVELMYLDPEFASREVAMRSLPEAGGRRGDSKGHTIQIFDARVSDRSAPSPRTLISDRGFALMECQAGTELAAATPPDPWAMVADTEAGRAAKARYNKALEAVIQRATGASYVKATNMVLRRSSIVGIHTRARGDDTPRGPVNDIHCDFTPEAYAIAKFDRFAARIGLAGCRYSVMNGWKSVARSGPVAQWPMAVCDARSVDCSRDLIPRVSPENGNTIYALLHSGNHKWFTYPHMTAAEVLLFKQYDTEPEAVARFVPHTAFDDPSSTPSAAVRESCEVRALCFEAGANPSPVHARALLALHRSGSGVVDPALVAQLELGAAKL